MKPGFKKIPRPTIGELNEIIEDENLRIKTEPNGDVYVKNIQEVEDELRAENLELRQFLTENGPSVVAMKLEKAKEAFELIEHQISVQRSYFTSTIRKIVSKALKDIEG